MTKLEEMVSKFKERIDNNPELQNFIEKAKRKELNEEQLAKLKANSQNFTLVKKKEETQKPLVTNEQLLAKLKELKEQNPEKFRFLDFSQKK